MDLLATLRVKVGSLPGGQHLSGLQAVLLHIETAYRHLSRGQQQGEDTAFTDAIYRTNQAFEGSVKEAYRVLAHRNPERKTPAQIEEYLERNAVFRPRVLSQLKNYRTEWRNPSTHEYKLDFDESEALLAIVSVTAFALLLLDQIAERLEFVKTSAEIKKDPELRIAMEHTHRDFQSDLESILLAFMLRSTPQAADAHMSEAQLLGGLAAFLTSSFPNSQIDVDHPLPGTASARADLVMTTENQKVVVELKRTQQMHGSILNATLSQVERYVTLANATLGAIIFLVPYETPYQSERHFLGSAVKDCLLIRPTESLGAEKRSAKPSAPADVPAFPSGRQVRD